MDKLNKLICKVFGVDQGTNAHIEYTTYKEAKQASLLMNGGIIDGEKIKVVLESTKKEGTRRRELGRLRDSQKTQSNRSRSKSPTRKSDSRARSRDRASVRGNPGKGRSRSSSPRRKAKENRTDDKENQVDVSKKEETKADIVVTQETKVVPSNEVSKDPVESKTTSEDTKSKESKANPSQ